MTNCCPQSKPFGDVVMYRTGIQGFRIEEGQDLSGCDVDVLFVGDSVTFGTGANKSCPLDFARISHLKSENAGVPWYGTDQSFLVARKAIEGQGLRPRRVATASITITSRTTFPTLPLTSIQTSSLINPFWTGNRTVTASRGREDSQRQLP